MKPTVDQHLDPRVEAVQPAFAGVVTVKDVGVHSLNFLSRSAQGAPQQIDDAQNNQYANHSGQDGRERRLSQEGNRVIGDDAEWRNLGGGR